MFVDNEISIFDLVYAISEIVDLALPDLNCHHKQVAYISCKIAQEMGLPEDILQDIVLSSILHDIGAFSTSERIKIKTMEEYDGDINYHAEMGCKLLKNFAHFANASEIIRYHHVNYDSSRTEIPIGSYVIHLADKLSLMFDEEREILGQVPAIIEKIYNNQEIFHPDVLKAFNAFSKFEYFWIEAYQPTLDSILGRKSICLIGIGNLITLRDFVKIVAYMIDFRSEFTSTHSSGVAAVASEIAKIFGFSAKECSLVEIAGFLHDVGKLIIPNEILEKNGALDDEEFNAVKKHAYYTYSILNKIKGFEQIALWASQHHERLDGNGYPFHIKDENFTKLARIVAVADIVTALSEDRPYRLGMSANETIEIICDMAKSGKLDKYLVKLVEENFWRINDMRVKAQQSASEEYTAFLS